MKHPVSTNTIRHIRCVVFLLLFTPILILGCNSGGDDPSVPPGADMGDTGGDSMQGDDGGGGSATGPADIGDNNPNLLVAIGDSITAGQGVSVSYPSRLSSILGQTVVNSGVSGALSSAASGQANSAIARKPAYLLIMFGTNDVFIEVPPETVAGNVAAAVRIARANKTIPVVASIPPNLKSEFQAGQVLAINNRLRSMASSQGARFADVHRAFGSGEGLIQGDGYHPNDTGAQTIAFTFADAVR